MSTYQMEEFVIEQKYLHVMLQPGCHSWKRQLLSPSPAHSNHQGHPKKPCKCKQPCHVSMCDPTKVSSNGKHIRRRTSFFQTLACFRACGKKHTQKLAPKYGKWSDRASTTVLPMIHIIELGANAYNLQ